MTKCLFRSLWCIPVTGFWCLWSKAHTPEWRPALRLFRITFGKLISKHAQEEEVSEIEEKTVNIIWYPKCQTYANVRKHVASNVLPLPQGAWPRRNGYGKKMAYRNGELKALSLSHESIARKTGFVKWNVKGWRNEGMKEWMNSGGKLLEFGP